MKHSTWSSPRLCLLLLGRSARASSAGRADWRHVTEGRPTPRSTLQHALACSCVETCSRLQQVRMRVSQSTTGCFRARDSGAEASCAGPAASHMRLCRDTCRRPRERAWRPGARGPRGAAVRPCRRRAGRARPAPGGPARRRRRPPRPAAAAAGTPRARSAARLPVCPLLHLERLKSRRIHGFVHARH